MTHRLTLLMMLAALMLAGCYDNDAPSEVASGEASAPSGLEAQTAPQRIGAPPTALSDVALPARHLAYVPADTPYVWAIEEPLPVSELAWRFEELVPLYDTMMERLEARIEAGEGDTGYRADFRKHARKLVWALGEELDGKLSEAGLAGLGFELQPSLVVYGDGAYPALRVDVSDAAAMSATVERVIARSGVPATRIGALHVLTFSDRVTVVAGVHDGAFVAAVTRGDAKAAAERLITPPTTSLADAPDALAEVFAHAPEGHGGGYLDLVRVIDTLAGEHPDSSLARSLTDAGRTLPMLSTECARDGKRIATLFPRVTLTAQPVSLFDVRHATLTLETSSQPLLNGLRGLKAGLPALDMKGAAAAFALNVDAEKAIDFAVLASNVLLDAPLECARFERINGAAARIPLGALIVPNAIESFQGANIVIEDVVASGEGRPRPRGFGFAKSSDVEALWDIVGTRFPAVAEVTAPSVGQTPTALQPKGWSLKRLKTLNVTRPDADTLAFDFGHDAPRPAVQPVAVADAPLVRVGWNSGAFFQTWIAARASELDDQTLGVSSVWANLSSRYGLRTLSLDVAERGVTLTFAHE